MALLNRLCHIGFHVPERQTLASDLVSKFGFELFATRVGDWCRQLVLRRGDAMFVVNEKLQSVISKAQTPPASSSSGQSLGGGMLYDVDPQCTVSTASNICFEVEDVSEISQNLKELGCHILVSPTTLADEDGSVTYSVVKSIVGNISHTLLDRSQYCGPFLPGFHVAKDVLEKFQRTKDSTHFDHITYACPQGSTPAVLEWYENCLGFQRVFIHPQDNAVEGFRIQGNGVGLQLVAMQPSGNGLTLLDQHDCKFILSESLQEQKSNQVDNFLKQHGGAGIQHVALGITDIIETTAAMAKSGASFLKPPIAYYGEKKKEQEVEQAGQDLQLLKDHGILLDTEVLREKIITMALLFMGSNT
ncbi:hypothetical protein JRQ81_014991 [Phrynocephalus forsythii]|uniref:4-hydroxyphenylpyruvate dioxygenase n=1 Tax=Phrynocephalus forsythii TaxID=171643 RepID=A0A9Q0XYF4_9SAUR|nr:hypothetical protein JRQ81_014991 [Phrynocephalus forsythii]